MDIKILNSLLALQPLEHLTRTGWAMHGISNPESIAAHINSMCHVVIALGPRIEPRLDTDRALALVAVHDAPEALMGDLPRSAGELLPAGAKHQAERTAAERLLAPLSDYAHERYVEYRAGETREARFVGLCDRLQLGVRLVAYERSGVRGLEEFHAVVHDLDCTEFAPAQELRREIVAALAT